MRKKYLLAVLLICLCAILTGCFRGEMKINIHSDGSADVDYKAVAAPIAEDVLTDLMATFRKDNFQITKLDEGSNAGFRATKHIENVSEISKYKLFEGKEANVPGIWLDKGWFFDSYKINVKSDMPNLKAETTSEFERAMLSQLKMTIIITFPDNPANHNATNIYDNGKTLEWVLNFDRNEYSIVAEATHWNTGHILITILIPLAMTLFLWIYKRKINEPENTSELNAKIIKLNPLIAGIVAFVMVCALGNGYYAVFKDKIFSDTQSLTVQKPVANSSKTPDKHPSSDTAAQKSLSYEELMLGGLNLDSTINQIVEKYGQPDKIEEREVPGQGKGQTVIFVKYIYQDGLLEIDFLKSNNMIFEIKSRASDIYTTHNIAAGYLDTDILRAYNGIDYIKTNYNGNTVYSYSLPKGATVLDFEINPITHKILSISINAWN